MNGILKKFKLMDIKEQFPQEGFITEIGELGQSFNEMTLRIEKLLDELIMAQMKQNRLEPQKKEAEIVSLQSQIKPHFLCNTMESIGCPVKENRNEAAAEMLRSLGDLFRYGRSKIDEICRKIQVLYRFFKVKEIIFPDN